MAEKLHINAVLQFLQGQCVAFDGLEIVAVMMLDGPGVRLDFRFHYLDGPEGYSVGPSRIVLIEDKHVGAGAAATFSCGLSQPEGSFWYASSTKVHNCFAPPSEYNWAFERSRLIGTTSLAQWRTAKKKNNK